MISAGLRYGKSRGYSMIEQEQYLNALKSWVKGGKKYPLESYLVNECDCGCMERAGVTQ